jgi:hypothetical protein
MKIHTNLDRDQLTAAARTAGVRFERFEQSGSRTHPRKFDVLLSGSSGRRANFGGDFEAASWDEWGIFLNLIFRADPDARAGEYYQAREHFRWATGHRFDTLTPADQHRNHRWRSHPTLPGQQGCRCGAVRRWDVPEARDAQLAAYAAVVRPDGRGPVVDPAAGTTLHRWAERAAVAAALADPAVVGARQPVGGGRDDPLPLDIPRPRASGPRRPALGRSRYESHGAYARDLLAHIDEVLAED